MLNKVLVFFVHSLQIACYKMFSNVVCGLCSVVLCTVFVPSGDEFCVASFADVFGNSFDCVFAVGQILSVFTLLLRW